MRRKMFRKYLLIILCLTASMRVFSLQAQNIERLSQRALNDSTQEIRLQAADSLQIVLLDTLTKNPLFSIDRLNNLSMVASDDHTVRVFTWCAPLDQGLFRYFGIVQKISDTSLLFVLSDHFLQEESTGNEDLTKEQWYGAMYLTMITIKSKKETFYTLLGWDGNNALSDIKVIENLYFDETNEPRFGKAVFDNCLICKRILLQYRQTARCSLRYEKQSASMNGKAVAGNMIIFNRLEPENQYFDGMKSMYIPTDVFDAYFWKDGMWHFLENIDARNY